MKPNGKSPITSDYDAKVMFFRDVSPGPLETQLRFRLIHLWEAWNPLKKTLIGLEMLLIDEHVLDFTKHIYLDSLALLSKGFISPGRIERYLPKMKPGSVYRLNNFYGSSNKSVYRVFDHAVTVSLSWNSELSVLEDSPTPFDEDRFRFHSFEDFQANCDRKGDLYGNLCYPPHHLFVAVLDVITYFLLFLLTHLMNNGIDVVGHMKLVNGQSIIETPVLDEVEIARARHVLVHVQSHDGPMMKLYLWDQAARDFCKKNSNHTKTPPPCYWSRPLTLIVSEVLLSSLQCPPHVFLWTTTSNLRSTTTGKYLRMFTCTLSLHNAISMTDLINAYYSVSGWALIHREVFFECTATIDDVVHGSTWYYISCSGYHTKATKGPTSLMCSKCGKVNIAGVAQYRAQISVYDNSEQAVFVLLGDAGYELTGKHAS
ncbi:hypothetical protein HID58_075559 [Brassica napus]|uniref:Replication factor A C-terminal domain-containing protein n=1 Tax=Brassica napus TaxID=3708 RepID=A0ABQ7YK99_BRANA|nr:hypothetical protein HID58_075559 [Brassica napus]